MVEYNYDDIVEKLVAKQDISDDDKSFNERLEISLVHNAMNVYAHHSNL